MSDYLKYRGKCKEMSEELCKHDPSLRLVRGHYICPLDGEEPHWWCVNADGEIIDPTVRQFKTNGVGAEYIEYNGFSDCCFCGESVYENDAVSVGNRILCSEKCYGDLLGITMNRYNSKDL